jgi:hypothetical protein
MRHLVGAAAIIVFASRALWPDPRLDQTSIGLLPSAALSLLLPDTAPTTGRVQERSYGTERRS